MQPAAGASEIADGRDGPGGRAPLTVAVVDPRPLVRSALVEALTADAGFDVLASGDTTRGGLEGLRGEIDVVVASDVAWSRGRRWVDPEPFDIEERAALVAAVRAEGLDASEGPAAGSPGSSKATPALTARESAVLDSFARGLTAAGAARDLGISASAVAGAKRRILTKLKVATIVEAIALQGRRGRPAGAPDAAER